MTDTTGLWIDELGYFRHDRGRLVPVGVNYWPGSCGVEMWARWPADEIERDLDLVRALGLNSIRFFLRWQDFEPEPGQYDRPAFQRLSQFLTWCTERELWAQPSLFVGWMSGGVFWPAWKRERNLYADPEMVARSAAFAGRAAEVIAPFHDGLLGIDQGNELCCLPDSPAAPPGAVVAWCRAVNEAVRDAYPGALIVSGNEQNQILNDTGWRFQGQPGTDYYSMHGYPVPSWHRVPFDGMTDPLCQSLLPFYTQVARAFGPVMLQEFGTIVTFGAAQQDAYLRAVLPACWEAGANGYLWWCLRDIRADVHPYLSHRFESTLGLVDDAGQVKPGLGYFLGFARAAQTWDPPRVSPDAVGLYWPKHYYDRDQPLNPGNCPEHLSRWLVMANYLLRQLGHPTRVVRGDAPLSDEVRTILVPGAVLDALEVRALGEWVRAGGRLVWHGPDPVNWGYECAALLGARPVDYRAPRPAEVAWGGETWVLAQYPRDMRVELAVEDAAVLARDDEGLPVVLANRVGQGKIIYALPVPEEEAAAVAGDRATRDRWQRWYAAALGE